MNEMQRQRAPSGRSACPPPAALQYLRQHLLPQEWIFAKTMPESPHWYTLRKTWDNDEAFVTCVQLLYDFGYDEWYPPRPGRSRRRRYKRVNIDGYKYWAMGWPAEQTILINRAIIEPPDCG